MHYKHTHTLSSLLFSLDFLSWFSHSPLSLSLSLYIESRERTRPKGQGYHPRRGNFRPFKWSSSSWKESSFGPDHRWLPLTVGLVWSCELLVRDIRHSLGGYSGGEWTPGLSPWVWPQKGNREGTDSNRIQIPGVRLEGFRVKNCRI